MNYQEGGQDKSTIECRYFRKNGECRKPGCPYLHRVAAVKPKAFKKVFQHQNDNNQGFQKELQGNQYNQPWRQNNYNRPQNQQGLGNFQFNRLNQINNDQQRNYNTYSSNYQGSQNSYNQRFDNNRPQQPFQQQQSLQQPTIGLQQLYKMHYENLKGFLETIDIGGSHYFGLVNNRGVSFILYHETKGVDLLQKIDFTTNFEIEDAYIQEYQLPNQIGQRYCLILVLTETTLKSVQIYPDFFNSQTNFIRVSDVSNTQLKYIRVNIQNNELYTFSSDGFVRVFTLSNIQSTLKHYVKLPEVFLAVYFLNEVNQGSSFLVATKQGNIYSYLSNQFTKIHSFSNINDLTIDQESKRVYIITKSTEGNSEIYFLNENNIVEGPIYNFKFPLTKIQCFKDFDLNNCLLVSDDRGQLDILKEQNSTDQIKFLRQSQHKLNMGEIKKILLFNMVNANKVIERLIFVQRAQDPAKNSQQNFEFYRFYQIF